MALSIQQIRDYAQTGSLAIDNAGQGPAQIVRTGFWHAFGSLVGWGSSVAQNRDTLNALRTAIQNDPRYFAPDVQARATELLNGVNVRRSVGVTQIKSIIAAIDQMSTPGRQSQSIVKIAGGHLAANGLPPEASGFEKQYKNMAQLYAARAPGQGRTFADIDVPGRLEAFRQMIADARGRLGDDPLARELFELFADKGALVNGAGKPRSADEIRAVAEQTRNLAEGLKAFGGKYGNAAMENVIDALRELGKPVSIKTVEAVFEKGRNLPKADLEKLGPGSSAADIHKAMRGAAKAFTDVLNGLQFESDDPFAFQIMQEIAGMGAASSLAPEARRNLFAAFKSEQGANLLQYYISNNMGVLQSSLINVACGMVSVLNTEIDGASPRQIIALPKEVDLQQIPIEITYEIGPGDIGSGKIGSAIVKGLARGVGVSDFDDDVGKLTDRFNAITKNTLVVHYAQQFNELRADDKTPGAKTGAKTGRPDFGKVNSVFVADLMSSRKINVVIRGEKRRLPKDAKVACDMLTQFVTGDDKATFEDAEEKTKVKVHMLMATANQGINGSVQTGVAEAFDPKASKGVINCSTHDHDTTITFSLNANNDVETDFFLLMNKNITVLTDSKSGNLPMAMHTLGDGSFVEYKARITIPKSDMEKFANAKWENYDHEQPRELVRADGVENRKEKGANAVPEEFRFTGDVKVYFRMQCDKETVMNVA